MNQEIISDILSIGTGTPFNNKISSIATNNTIFNNNKLNIDFEVKGTGTYASLYYDASAGRLGIGTGLPDAVLHVIAPCAKDGVIIESITNCPTGVTLLLVHNPQTPPQTNSYPAIISLAGRDTNNNEIAYGQIKSKILNPLTSNTSGEISFLVDHTGIPKEVFVAGLTNLILGANNNISGFSYEIIGHNNSVSGINYLNIGSNNIGSTLDDSINIGNNNALSGPQLFIISNNSDINGSGLFMLGLNNVSYGNGSLLCGLDTSVTGSNNLLIANSGFAIGSYNLGLIQKATISGVSGIVLGTNSVVSGNNNISIGNVNNIFGTATNAVGSFVSASGHRNEVFGNNVFLSGDNLISIGSNQTVSGISNGIFVGNDVDLSNTQNILYIGFNNHTQSGLANSVILGANNDLDNGNVSNVVLLGQYNITKDAANSIIVGHDNNASGSLKNNIVMGSGNALTSNNYNNIFLGALNNQTGIYINSQGETMGLAAPVQGDNTNSISIGTHNISTLSNSNILLGHKNIVSGLNINVLGSFNNLRNTNKIYVLGNSNYLEGENLIVLGKNVFGLGKNIIGMNNANNTMDIYGSGSIAIGHNPILCSGIVVGNNNNINGVSGLIYGANNTLGVAKHTFTYNTSSPSEIYINGLVGVFYKINDEVLVQVKNPAGVNNTFKFQLNGVSENTLASTTTLSLNGIITSNLSDRYYTLNNSFDENNTPTTIGSGIVIALKNYEKSTYYGSNDIVLGSSNIIKYSDSIIVGNNNNASGTNVVVIGNNITGVSDQSVHIGSSNSNKIVLDNNQIVFNTGTVQEKIVVRGYSGNVVEYHDLLNSRLGINNTNPSSALDVSGTITAQAFRMGYSSVNGSVLTSDQNGQASWQIPASLSGTDQGMLFKLSDKVASGISSIKYMSTHTGINFYDNIYILRNSGIIINADKGTNVVPVPLTVWGSGGVFAPKLMELTPGVNMANFYRIAAESGSLTGLNVASSVNFPKNLTGTLLYVNNSGNFLNRNIYHSNVLFSNDNSDASGNTKFRWMNDQSTLVLGITSGLSETVISTNALDTTYNIVLSSDSSINTSFNNKGLGNVFSVYRSGSAGTNNRTGFHILPISGQVGINSSIGDINNSNAMLYVNGKIAANSLKLNSNPVAGQYLKTSTNGDIVTGGLDLNVSFTGDYPVVTNTNPVTNIVTVGLSNNKPGGEAFTVSEYGHTIVFNGTDWVTSSGLQVWQESGGNRGISLGYGASLSSSSDNNGAPNSTNGIVYAGGSFTRTNPTRRGSSQFSQFFLRARTNNTSQQTYMTMNWDTLNSNSYERTSNNTIKFPADKHSAWTYTAYVNVLWADNTNANKGAGGYIIEGTVCNIDGNLTHLNGGPSITKHVTSNTPANAVSVELSSYGGSSIKAMDFRVSGVTNYTMLWSATVNINQLNWSSSDQLSAS